MKYILNPEIALRSWWYVPYAYYIWGDYRAKKLTKEEFEFLSQCDGEAELPEDELAETLEKRGFIRPARPCERMHDWQRPRFCNNRYFPHASLMLTGKCNYNCLHCFNAADNARLQSEFTLEEVETLFDQMEQCGITALTLTGGEPMMHPHFMDVVRSAYQHHIFIDDLNTNGYFITQEILDEMKSIGFMPMIKISFDGVGHHDWLRNRAGAEADALRAFRLCRENGFHTMAQMNVHRKNADVLMDTAKLLDDMGVDVLRIIRTSESPRWTENAGDCCLDIEEYFELATEFCRKYAQTGCRMNIVIWQFDYLYPESKEYALIGYGEGEYRDSLPVCKGNRGKVAIAADGNVFPCHQMSGYYEKHGDLLGNVRTDGLQPLLQKSKYLCEVCTTVKELREKNPVCDQCEWIRYCAGGCRAIGLALTGDKMGVDKSKCIFYKKGYPKKIAEALPGWTSLTEIKQ